MIACADSIIGSSANRSWCLAKVIKVVPVPEYFSITWTLGSRCNYDCMYCPTELHDSTSRHHDLGTLKQMWQRVHEKSKHLGLPYKISFTGGEVTTNKHFLPFVEWLKQQASEISILVTTNGSAGKKYYRRLAQLVDAISFSTHSEFMDEREFFEKAAELNKLMIPPAKSFHVGIMDEFWNTDRKAKYIEFCESNSINHSVNLIDYKMKNRDTIFFKGKQNLDAIRKS